MQTSFKTKIHDAYKIYTHKSTKTTDTRTKYTTSELKYQQTQSPHKPVKLSVLVDVRVTVE